MFQPLEARQLLAAALVDGVLTVTGTAKNDRISIVLSRNGDTITVSETSGNRFRKGTTTKTDFVADDVTSIIVNAAAGNDSVALGGGARRTPFALSATINGDSGNDSLTGAAGNDTINGGDGDDDLFGNKGTDLLSGNAGDDLLVGGADIDTLNGNDGDDLLKSAGDSVIDIVDGGADSAATGEDDQDSALADDDETVLGALVVDPSDLWHPPIFGGGGFGHGPGGHGHGPSGGSNSGNTTTSKKSTI
jgi:Ca2+-binding RTX toxin-like protein